MKLISSTTSEKDIISKLQRSNITVEISLLDLLTLVGNYGNTKPFQTLANVVATLDHWNTSSEIVNELDNKEGLDYLIDYESMVQVVETELKNLIPFEE